jgi:hypothetical protein
MISTCLDANLSAGILFILCIIDGLRVAAIRQQTI